MLIRCSAISTPYLQVHVEISLPDEGGRLQILRIHTTPMREAGVLAKDVELPHLAAETKNFSGFPSRPNLS